MSSVIKLFYLNNALIIINALFSKGAMISKVILNGFVILNHVNKQILITQISKM